MLLTKGIVWSQTLDGGNKQGKLDKGKRVNTVSQTLSQNCLWWEVIGDNIDDQLLNWNRVFVNQRKKILVKRTEQKLRSLLFALRELTVEDIRAEVGKHPGPSCPSLLSWAALKREDL